MKKIIFLFILLFIAGGIKCQSSRADVSLYTIYKSEETNYNTGRSEHYNQHGFVSISLGLKKIVIVRGKLVDSFRIQGIDHMRLTTVDTGFNAKCIGGKEPLKFISFDIVDSKEFGYNARLLIAYRNRSVSYYLKSGILAQQE
jgi:hypothetical protein